MTLYEMRKMDREEGRKAGWEEGREEGREEGLEAGREEGRLSELLAMVHDGLVPYEAAAERASRKYNIKEEDFRKMLDSFSDVEK